MKSTASAHAKRTTQRTWGALHRRGAGSTRYIVSFVYFWKVGVGMSISGRDGKAATALQRFAWNVVHDDFRELSAVDPRWYTHNSSSTEYTQTLSRDIKESCLTLKIKLISCQDFTRACVTANDMLKPCKKKINMSNAKPISFCASLNYAHLY